MSKTKRKPNETKLFPNEKEKKRYFLFSTLFLNIREFVIFNAEVAHKLKN